MAPKFGNYAILDPVVHHLAKNPEWWWKIKPPTSGDELAMTKFVGTPRYGYDATQARFQIPITTMEIAYREISLLFAGTNIPSSEVKVEDGGEPIISLGATVEAIESVLAQMPQALVNELWKAVKEAAPTWGPAEPENKGYTTGDQEEDNSAPL